MTKRVILIVLDSVGVGALPDTVDHGDEQANTLLHIRQAVPDIQLPHLDQLGIGLINDLPYSKNDRPVHGSYGKLIESSAGKDTTTGHWEIAGLISRQPMPTFPDGFPREMLQLFEDRIGIATLGNKANSGTEIIHEYGSIHLVTGRPIVYTSADSVFQIAAHESVVPLQKLYRYCEIAREILKGPWAVGRVIARPFTGEDGSFTRTSNRHDYSLTPPTDTMLDLIKQGGLPVVGVGKIRDIFANRGLTDAVTTSSDMDGVDQTLKKMAEYDRGLIFTNLVDFDMKYGHRNDIRGYAKALEDFDQRLPEILTALQHDDLLVITADHGCDPTVPGTDHTREYIPALFFGREVKQNFNFGIRNSFADIGATVTEYLDCEQPVDGISFLNVLT